MTKLLKIIDPGAYTTVQDGGRVGFRQFGVPPTGSLDRYAHRMANILVGNKDNAAVLEMTFTGVGFEILGEADMALTGADMPLIVNNRHTSPWRTFRVYPGDQVNIGQTRSGCRCYLAVTGGIKVPEVMGSLSCDAGAGVGGYKGRALKRGDTIDGKDGSLLDEMRSVPDDWIPRYASRTILRCIPGPQEEYFSHNYSTFYNSTFTISPQANRKGYRLQGPEVSIDPSMPKSIISEPCLPGCIQVPEDGQPIILLNEQTVGGYAKIATLISADLDLIAQALPGDQIQFEAVDIETADSITKQRHARLEMLRQNIVSCPPMEKSFIALWNMDSRMFSRKIQKHLNQMQLSRIGSKPT